MTESTKQGIVFAVSVILVFFIFISAVMMYNYRESQAKQACIEAGSTWYDNNCFAPGEEVKE